MGAHKLSYHFPFLQGYKEINTMNTGLPNRHEAGNEYRYGFQGQEKDDEIKGEGNSINYKYRMHDPRVGRFFAVDPLTAKYPHNGPYNFSENRVIDGVELEGLKVVTSSVAVSAKLGVAAAAINASTSAGIAIDMQGNIAITMSKGLTAFAVNKNLIGTENVETGNTTVGGAADLSTTVSFTTDNHVTDLKGKGYSMDIGVGILFDIGVTIQFDDKFNFSGLEASAGISIGASIGREATNTSLVSNLYDFYSKNGMTPLLSVNGKMKQTFITLKQGEGDKSDYYYVTVVDSKGNTLHTVDNVSFKSIGDGSFSTEATLNTKEEGDEEEE